MAGKPGNTAKLKEKIFFHDGIFPRHSRLPAGTDFLQVNKNAQMVGKHFINEARNLKYQKSRSTKSFQGNFLGQQFFFYPWNTISSAELKNLKHLQRTGFHKPSKSNLPKVPFDSLQSLHLKLRVNFSDESSKVAQGKISKSKELLLEKKKMLPTTGKNPAMEVDEDPKIQSASGSLPIESESMAKLTGIKEGGALQGNSLQRPQARSYQRDFTPPPPRGLQQSSGRTETQQPTTKRGGTDHGKMDSNAQVLMHSAVSGKVGNGNPGSQLRTASASISGHKCQ